MILVNNAGDGNASYIQLRHSPWNGCTIADLVFPMFLFIVGASIAIVIPRRLANGVSHCEIVLQVVRRAALIALVGLLLNALPLFQLATLRYYGVLQRIAICYLIAILVFLYGSWRGCAAAALVLLGGYWLMLRYAPVPGFGVPTLDMPLLDRHANLAAWLDRELVPAAHLYHGTDYDPEGLLSTMPAVATTLFGVLSFVWLRANKSVQTRVIGLAATGALLLGGGLLWSHSFPFNKRLWTSSFVLFNGGLDAMLAASLYLWIDGTAEMPRWLRKGLWPWLAFGSNALTAYVLSEVLAIVLGAVRLPSGITLQRWLFLLLPQGMVSPPFVSLVYSVLFVAVCFVPIMLLYRRKIFLKL
jgi:predicted acyltransferase